jgi:hypothetical protein
VVALVIDVVASGDMPCTAVVASFANAMALP